MGIDPNGSWPETWEEFVKEVEDKSFAYNVIIKSITLYAGAGVGIGLPLKIIETTTHAEKGVGLIDGRLKYGEFGENSASINILFVSIGYYRTGFTDDNGTQEPWKEKFDVKLKLPTYSFSYVCSVHAEASFSVIGFFENLG